jgi:hypothetical protein
LMKSMGSHLFAISYFYGSITSVELKRDNGDG